MHAVLAILAASAVFYAVRLRLVRLGGHRAAIVTGPRGWQVVLDGVVVALPPIRVVETIELGPRTVEHVLAGDAALRFRDDATEAVRVRVVLELARDGRDVLEVARAFGCAGANDPRVLQRLLVPPLVERLRPAPRRPPRLPRPPPLLRRRS